MKRILSAIFTSLLLSICVFPVFAGQSDYLIPNERLLPLVYDKADILNYSAESELISKLQEISKNRKCEVAVVTVFSLEGKSSQAFADDFYDYNGYGYGTGDDGILLLIAMEDRDWAITTYGIACKAFSDSGQKYITDKIVSYLSDGNYSEAFTIYAEQCDLFLEKYETDGIPYDTGNFPNKPMSSTEVIIALAIGGIIAFIATGMMKSKLKTVRSQPMASSYIRKGSFTITDSRDIFLTKKVTKTPIPKEKSSSSGSGSSGHISSSGRTHGGSSGKF